MNLLRLPIVAAQGFWVRWRTEDLPPAAGPSTGLIGEATGNPLRLGVLGDSTAAGCGVDSHDDGFTGCLARELATRTGRGVRWEVIGEFAATSRQVRQHLLPLLGENLDVAALLVGVNDVLTRRTTREWREDLSALVDELTNRAKHVVVTGIPPLADFPALPGSLGRYLGERASRLDAVARQVCVERPRVTWIDSAAIRPIEADFFARDRFHPSARGYQRWAGAVAERL